MWSSSQAIPGGTSTVTTCSDRERHRRERQSSRDKREHRQRKLSAFTQWADVAIDDGDIEQEDEVPWGTQLPSTED